MTGVCHILFLVVAASAFDFTSRFRDTEKAMCASIATGAGKPSMVIAPPCPGVGTGGFGQWIFGS